MNYGFLKTATATPKIRVADCEYNTAAILSSIDRAAEKGCELIVFPELCVTGSTCADLFYQRSLIDAAKSALVKIARHTDKMSIVAVVGAPIVVDGKLYDCAVVIFGGKILGIVPRTQFISKKHVSARHFAAADTEYITTVSIGEAQVPFGARQLFKCSNASDLVIGIEIGDEAAAIESPALKHAVAGATVIVNPFAEFDTVNASNRRKTAISAYSAKLACGYVSAGAGDGESTTDGTFSGYSLIAENGTVLVESKLYENELIISDIDTELIARERLASGQFGGCSKGYTETFFTLGNADTKLTRKILSSPFIPKAEDELAKRAKAVLKMQSEALKKRLEHIGCRSAVIGISGGLDSCLALLVTVMAMDSLNRPRTDIIAVTMPCYATTKRTKSNAEAMCEQLGVSFREVDITKAVDQHFSDIGQDPNKYDVTYENAQARERTQVIMDIANMNGGIVIGTGDLSELALGWATYNGDHMSMYGVNASVPKTLIRHLVRYYADTCGNDALAKTLIDVLETPVSPELIPGNDGSIAQKTEDIVGPYELHDFFIYYCVRYGFAPDKIYYLARCAFEGRYDNETILKWLKNYYRRFFAQQFKRSCLPDGPKIGSVSLSPRGDWCMPSDACATLWIRQAEAL